MDLRFAFRLALEPEVQVTGSVQHCCANGRHRRLQLERVMERHRLHFDERCTKGRARGGKRHFAEAGARKKRHSVHPVVREPRVCIETNLRRPDVPFRFLVQYAMDV
jgi:hypothetical protein